MKRQKKTLLGITFLCMSFVAAAFAIDAKYQPPMQPSGDIIVDTIQTTSLTASGAVVGSSLTGGLGLANLLVNDHAGVASNLQSGDKFIIWDNGSSVNNAVTWGTILSEIVNDSFIAQFVSAPSTSSDSCELGDFAEDNTYLYVCTGTDTWRRVALSTW